MARSLFTARDRVNVPYVVIFMHENREFQCLIFASHFMSCGPIFTYSTSPVETYLSDLTENRLIEINNFLMILMKSIEIKGSLREAVGKTNAKSTRKHEEVPCVLYGKGENVHFKLTEKFKWSISFSGAYQWKADILNFQLSTGTKILL